MARDVIYSGGGTLYFRRLNADGTHDLKIPFGKTDGITLDTSVEFKEHYDTEGCEQVLDARLSSKKTATVKFETSEITIEMLANAFGGEITSETQDEESGATQTIDGSLVKGGYIVEIGKYNVSNLEVKESGDDGATYVLGKDYDFCSKTGYITILVDGDIADGTDLDLTYDVPAQTVERMASFKYADLQGEFEIVTSSQTGNNYKWVFKKLSVVNEGSFEIKGSDIGKLSFTGSALKTGEVGDGSDYFDIVPLNSDECC